MTRNCDPAREFATDLHAVLQALTDPARPVLSPGDVRQMFSPRRPTGLRTRRRLTPRPVTPDPVAMVEENVGVIWVIINRHFAALMRIVGEDEVFQQAYLGALEAAERFDASLGYKFTTFMGSCVWGKLQDLLKSHRRAHGRPACDTAATTTPGVFDPNILRKTLVDPRPPASQGIEDSERAAFVVDRLLALAASDRDRTILAEWCDGDGTPRRFCDVAESLGLPTSTVRKVIGRIRSQILEAGLNGELGPDIAEWCGSNGDSAEEN
ncbi:sigma-70 family RNA polymerase sigma factor [Limnoglobus roseus]|uniref:RNA polymerase sigma-70 region 2 domain-containing protein n=1 Tax=Limnoglobus roseus TaxID=2598579 RepID=A0A5C1AQL7_9BACT|nr:sigma-70 family RNA polymerase sigma factor [Limnoglobus roseus]QEL19148.1 hypothetical protein PX52LOC_06206 [Limnoglobus roseus]